jgi:hypothetical protein
MPKKLTSVERDKRDAHLERLRRAQELIDLYTAEKGGSPNWDKFAEFLQERERKDSRKAPIRIAK